MINVVLTQNDEMYSIRPNVRSLAFYALIPIIFDIVIIGLTLTYLPKMFTISSPKATEIFFAISVLILVIGLGSLHLINTLIFIFKIATSYSGFTLNIDDHIVKVNDKEVSKIKYQKKEFRIARSSHVDYYICDLELGNKSVKFYLTENDFIDFKELIDKHSDVEFKRF